MTLRTIALACIAALTTTAASAAVMCSTDSENCSGTWQTTNTTAEETCYVLFLGNREKNFCLKPGESVTERVQFGDQYCVAQVYTPNGNSCNRQYFAVITP